MKKSFKDIISEAKKKTSDPVKEVEKELEPKAPEEKPKVDDVKIDDSKFAIVVSTVKEPKGKLNLKIVKNESTFNDNEVEALKKIFDKVGCSKFTSETAIVNMFRAERKYIYIPESSKSVTLAMMKNSGKIFGYFDAQKNTAQDKNMQTGGDDMNMPDVLSTGVNASFEFSSDELKDFEKVAQKLNIAFAEFYEATEWCKEDEESFQDWMKTQTANDEVDIGESVVSGFGQFLNESSFGDNLAETIKAVYAKLPLEEAKKFYLALQKIIAEYSFVNREEMSTPVEDTPTLDGEGGEGGEEGEDNVEVSKDAL